MVRFDYISCKCFYKSIKHGRSRYLICTLYNSMKKYIFYIFFHSDVLKGIKFTYITYFPWYTFRIWIGAVNCNLNYNILEVEVQDIKICYYFYGRYLISVYLAVYCVYLRMHPALKFFSSILYWKCSYNDSCLVRYLQYIRVTKQIQTIFYFICILNLPVTFFVSQL